MSYRLLERLKCLLGLGTMCLVLASCGTPATVSLPSSDKINAHQIEIIGFDKVPAPVARILPGDVLSIVRDEESFNVNGWQTINNPDHVTYSVRTDGLFAYPYAESVAARGLTPEEVGANISHRLAKLYRHPEVTVNIDSSTANRVFVGGAVRNPSAVDMGSAEYMQQAIIAAGGVLTTADSSHVALLRMSGNGKYTVYFFDYSQLLKASDQPGVMLQRGDIVFVPKSAVGNAIDAVDVYLNQLLPFSKAISLGFAYNLNPIIYKVQ